jgi:hypothetical protein
MGSINEKIQTRNLFNKNDIIENYRLLNDGSLYSDNLYITGSFIKVLPNTNYVFNSMVGSECICEYDKNKNCTGRTIMGSGSSVTTTSNTAYVRISVQKSKLNIFQFEPGTTATPYVEHEEQDYSIFVQQPMRSIGDVKDCFVKKSDGWYERHFIARKIFDGTEYWTFSVAQGGHSRFDFRIADAVLGSITNNPIQSNRFRTNFAAEDNSIFLSGVEPTISIICDEFRTLNGFKTMLAEKYANGNPVYADYLRKTPLDLPCTETQIQQLENLPSTYKDFTIINSEDETPAYLEVSGIYDLNKLITRTEVLESEV